MTESEGSVGCIRTGVEMIPMVDSNENATYLLVSFFRFEDL